MQIEKFMSDEEEEEEQVVPSLPKRRRRRLKGGSQRKTLEPVLNIDDGSDEKVESGHETERVVEEPTEKISGFVRGLVESSVCYLRFRVPVLKEFLLIAKNVLDKNCRISVVQPDTDDSESFVGIAVADLNLSRTCMLMARLECEVLTTEPKTSFTVPLNIFSAFTHTLSGEYNLDLQISKHCNDEVVCRGYMPETPNQEKSLVLSLIQDDSPVEKMQDFKHQFTIDLDLGCLGESLKFAKTIDADFICFTISIPRSRSSGDESVTYFEISARGTTARMYERFESKTKTQQIRQGDDDDDFCPTVISTSPAKFCYVADGPHFPSRSQLKVLVRQEFPRDILAQCVRNMSSRRTLTLRMSPQIPLLLFYSMGSVESYMAFVVGPRVSDDEDE